MRAGRGRREALLNFVDEVFASLRCQRLEAFFKIEFFMLLADEVEYIADFLASVKAQATAKLLYEEYRALGWA